MNRHLLLDRDGTIIHNRHYLADPNGIEFLPGALAGLARLRDLGFDFVLVTNQSGVGRGYFSEERLGEIHDRLEALLGAAGIRLAGIYYCPHAPEFDCDCRKPRTGMVLRAARELGFSPVDSVMIGDSVADIQLAHNLGIPGIFVRGQYELPGDIIPTAIVENLIQVADWLGG
jgi:D-glycero-D-manno-heptose 1,7-bisphosphate phosphatase